MWQMHFWPSLNPVVFPLNVLLLKLPKKSLMIEQTSHSGKGEEREKGNGKETFYSRTWRLQNESRNCHTFEGGSVNMKVGVTSQSLHWECWRPASMTALLICKEQGRWVGASFSSLGAGSLWWHFPWEGWRRALPSFKVLVISKFMFPYPLTLKGSVNG